MIEFSFVLLLIVQQQSCAIIERLGKFHRIARPGLGVLIPFIDHIFTRLSLRISQLNVSVETKTIRKCCGFCSISGIE